MGFRNGTYATVWSAEPIKDTITTIRISTSRKDANNEYVQDFSGFVRVVGTAAASKAAKLTKGSRIKLGEIEVTTSYNAETKKEYTNFTVFSFEEISSDGVAIPAGKAKASSKLAKTPLEGDNDVEDDDDDTEDLPF